MDNSHAPQNPREIRCPFCPMCGWPPPFIYDSFAQAFCINEDCTVLMWSPWDTAAKNLSNMSETVWITPDEEN